MSDLILNPEGFGLKVYNRFPPSYREDDMGADYALRRFLDTCGDGGFRYNIEELNGILDFANPDRVAPQVLPILFKQYGLDIFHGIPEMYLRYLLPRLGEAWSKKGSLYVINFVASAIAGVKTSLGIEYGPNDEVDVDLFFEMDYTIGNYFPDTKQLRRVLYNFLPFYLDMHLVYVYVYHDPFALHGDDIFYYDKLTLIHDDTGLVSASGLFHDDISVRYLEEGFIAHRITSDSSEEVDTHLDKISLVPITETFSFGEVRDEIKDHLVIKPIFTPTLNTGLVLNNNFILNSDNSERGCIHGSIEDSFSINTTKVICCEDSSLSEKDVEHIGVSYLVKEQASVSSIDEETMEHWTTQFSIESGSIDTVDITETHVQGVTQESATFVFSPLLCMVTNTQGRVLNTSTLDIPEEIEVIHYRNGSSCSIFR